MNIFVGSLPFNLSEAELKGVFEEYGEVTSVRIITDKFTRRSKGFGFIDMPDDEQANNAIKELNGSDVKGRNIVVNKAEERKDDNRRSNFRSNDNNRDRGGYNKGGGYGDKRGGGGRRSSY